ncbi:MAG: DUF1330 domain-containing protein [Acidimicrobiia bacterium]|nr:DUF1330 domain-containing protein [Acidimicrobiia bacterium]
MTAYLIVNYDVDDADQYAEYQGGAAPALKIGDESQVLVLDHDSELLEGDPGAQTVVLEFESKEKALETYRSGAYQKVVGTRLGATSKHFAVVVDKFG